MPDDWFQVHDNIVLLADWMASNGYEASDVAYMVEKPWKYEAEFKQAVTSQETEDED